IVGIVYLCIVFRAITKSVKNKWGEGKPVIFLWLTLPVFLAGALGLFVPVFSYFRLLFVLPSLYIFLALGIEVMDKKLASLAVCFVLTVNIMSSCLYLFNQQFQ